MKERPILFSAPMVLALLAGTKTQTRRIVKLPKNWVPCLEDERDAYGPVGLHIEPRGRAVTAANEDTYDVLDCPFGAPGDRLWVRETWGFRGQTWTNLRPQEKRVFVAYQADASQRTITRESNDDSGLPEQHCLPRFKDKQHSTEEHYEECLTAYWRSWRPSIHMPRWASRITLEVTGVRVERLQAISREDAVAEGIERYDCDGVTYFGPLNEGHAEPQVAYRWLWESINGTGSWIANPWVWVVSFKRVTP